MSETEAQTAENVHEDQCQARHPGAPAARCRLERGHGGEYHYSLMWAWSAGGESA
jgi:hypothetical protein